MESVIKKNQINICNEGDEQSEDNKQKISLISHELEIIFVQTQPSLFGQHQVRLPRSVAPIPNHGLPRRRGFEVPSWK